MIIGFVGRMGSGKTLSMVRALIDFKRSGKTILSNFHLNFDHYLIDFDSLLEHAQDQGSLNNVVLALDEAHILLDSRASPSKRNRIISFWILQTRKMDCIMLYTTQNYGQIDKRLRLNTDYWVQCEGIHVILDDGSKHFICDNTLSDGVNLRRDIFYGASYYKYYETKEIIKWMATHE